MSTNVIRGYDPTNKYDVLEFLNNWMDLMMRQDTDEIAVDFIHNITEETRDRLALFCTKYLSYYMTDKILSDMMGIERK